MGQGEDPPPVLQQPGGAEPIDPTRRRLLSTLAAGLASGVALTPAVLTGCGPSTPPPPPGTRVPLAELTAGRHLRVHHRGIPVDVHRDGAGTVVARSLLCAHEGCEIDWSGAEAAYLCRCHGGKFDGDGRPIAGPPNRPLRELAVRVEGDAAWVEG